ncbi:single-stranded DNA-binding protein [Georgenia subflava]|nr:single-stranded DNA-binding protein [Georgenia subflava]
MSNEIKVTVRGFVGSEPVRHVVPSGKTFARFRVASTSRIRDSATGEFRDGDTVWFTVKAWKELAENILASLHKGTPVVLSGTLVSETWQSEQGERSSNVVKVDAIGPDLNTGTANFVKTVRSTAADGDGENASDDPEDESGAGAVAGLTGPDGVRFTGEELPDEPPLESQQSTDYEMASTL